MKERLRGVTEDADDHFESPRLLIERGRELIVEVQVGVRAFFDRKPYAKVVDFDDATGQQVHKVRLTAKMPGRIKALVKDVAENLRSALDHAVYGNARALGVDDPKHTGFPFAETAILGELGKDRLKGNPAEIRALLASFEPHANGNQTLWGLNRLRAPNTHRILSPVLITAAGTSVGLGSIQMKGGGAGGQIGYSKWNPERAEVEYMRLPHGSTYKYELEVRYEVVFGNIDGLNEKEVISTLRAMADEVERVVIEIKAETARVLAARTHRGGSGRGRKSSDELA